MRRTPTVLVFGELRDLAGKAKGPVFLTKTTSSVLGGGPLDFLMGIRRHGFVKLEGKKMMIKTSACACYLLPEPDRCRSLPETVNLGGVAGFEKVKVDRAKPYKQVHI